MVSKIQSGTLQSSQIQIEDHYVATNATPTLFGLWLCLYGRRAPIVDEPSEFFCLSVCCYGIYLDAGMLNFYQSEHSISTDLDQ